MKRRVFLARAAYSAAGFGILRNISACKTLPAVVVAPIPASFAQLRDQFFLFNLQHNPTTATYLGGDAYDPSLRDINSKLRDYSPNSIAQEVSYYRQLRASLNQIDPTTLPPRERVDYKLMIAQVDFLIHQGADVRAYERFVDTYVGEPFRGIDWQIQQMQEFPNGGLGTKSEWDAVVERMRAIPRFVEVAQQNLLAGRKAVNMPDRRMIQRDGINGSKANADYFRTTLPKTAEELLANREIRADVMKQLAPVALKTASAWDSFAEFLARTFDVNEAADRFPAGTEEYEWRVHHALGDPRSAAELYDYGLQQVGLYTSRMFDVAKNFASEAKMYLSFDTPAQQYAGVRAVMDFLSKDSPKNDDELLRWYKEAGVRAVAFGREKQLFDVPVNYRLDVYPTPPVLRSTIDAAYYPAPPFKKTGVGRFYLTPTDNDPAALKQNNFASVADTAVHEGFPGHDWHYKFMTSQGDRISNIRWLTPGAVEDSASMWSDSMAAEGWALYSEELMSQPVPNHQYGFYSTGEYLYELQGQLLRSVRIVVDVGIHTRRMTFDQAMDYFTEHVLFQPNARQRAVTDSAAKAAMDSAQRAIYRYSKWPTQAITYNLGKNAIINLREAFKAKRGALYSDKNFHERFMSMGTIPVSYFREEFLAGDVP